MTPEARRKWLRRFSIILTVVIGVGAVLLYKESPLSAARHVLPFELSDQAGVLPFSFRISNVVGGANFDITAELSPAEFDALVKQVRTSQNYVPFSEAAWAKEEIDPRELDYPSCVCDSENRDCFTDSKTPCPPGPQRFAHGWFWNLRPKTPVNSPVQSHFITIDSDRRWVRAVETSI